MKKQILTGMAAIAFMAGAVVSASAQDMEEAMEPLKSPAQIPWGTNTFIFGHPMAISQQSPDGTAWTNTDKANTPLDAHGNFTEIAFFKWNTTGGTWDVNQFNVKMSYTYDANGHLATMRRYMKAGTQEVIRNAVYTVNTSGDVTMGAYTDSMFFGTWLVLQTRDELTYDGSGRLTEKIYSTKNPIGGTYEPQDRFLYTYDANGNGTEALQQSWDGTSAWEDQSRKVYTYDAGNRMTTFAIEDWIGTGWETTERKTWQYDANGRLIQEEDFEEENGTLVQEYRNTISYNSSGKIESWISETDTNGTLTTDKKNVPQYASSGEPEMVLIYDWTGSAWSTTVTGRIIYSENPTNSPPSPPSDLTATPKKKMDNGKVELKWKDNSNNEEGFIIHRSPDNSAWTSIDSIAADITTYTDSGLVAETKYYYRVSAWNSAGASDPSNTVDAITFAAGIAETACSFRLSVYPNPTSGSIVLAFAPEATGKVMQLNLINVLGETVFTETGRVETQKQLSLGHLTPGVYVLRLEVDGGLVTRQIIVQK